MGISFLFTLADKPLILNVKGINDKATIAYTWLASSLQIMDSINIYGVIAKAYSNLKRLDDVLVELIVVNDRLSKGVLEYLNINPLASLSVDRISILFTEGGSNSNKPRTNPFTHKYVKSSAYISKSVIDDDGLLKLEPVSEVTLYALTSGIDRFGMTAKYLALQFSFIEDILSILLERLGLNKDNRILDEILKLSPYKCNTSYCNCVDKIASLIALAIGFAKTLRAPLAAEAAQTTAIWAIEPDEVNIIENEIFNVLSMLYNELPRHVDCTNCPELVRITKDGRKLNLCLFGKHNYVAEKLASKALGRISNVMNTIEWLYRQQNLKGIEKTVLGDFIVFEWSEQMGPVDIALLLALYIASRTQLPKTIWIIATPLTLPHAILGKAYLDYISRSIGNIRSKIILSSGVDKHVIKSTIEYVLREKKRRRHKNSKILYIAGGSTLHTIIASLILQRREDIKIISWTRPGTT